jgi:AraC-like DNA-binding protein/quercetin dioxygenase-like cupin family protein
MTLGLAGRKYVPSMRGVQRSGHSAAAAQQCYARFSGHRGHVAHERLRCSGFTHRDHAAKLTPMTRRSPSTRFNQSSGMAPRDDVRFHDFPVAGVDAMTASTGRSFPRHTHDEYGIGLIDSGGHASWSGRGQVEAGPGSFICVNPGEVHDGRAIGRRPRSWRILYFDPVLMDETRADVGDGAHAPFTFAKPVFADDPMRRLFDAAFAHTAATMSPVDRMACETAILSLVARLAAHSTIAPGSHKGPTACVRRARKRIDADPAAPVKLIELAREVGLSRYQLLRGFARDLGLTPHAYILQRRIALARRLIRAGRPLAEVALVAGFYDQSHLTRHFVRQVGVSPGRYALNTR